MKLIGISLIIGLSILSPVTEAEIYKWVDENGQVHYGEKPPEENKSTTEFKLKKQQQTNTIPATPAERKRKQEQLIRALSEERQIKEEAKAKQEKEEAKRRRQCMYARDRLKSYEQANLIYRLNDKGERVYYSDQQRDSMVARYKADIAKHCN